MPPLTEPVSLRLSPDRLTIGLGEEFTVAWTIVGWEAIPAGADLQLQFAFSDGLSLLSPEGIRESPESLGVSIPALTQEGDTRWVLTRSGEVPYYHLQGELMLSGEVLSVVDLTFFVNAVRAMDIEWLTETIQMYPGGQFAQTGGTGSMPSGPVQGYFDGYSIAAGTPTQYPDVSATFRISASCSRYGSPYSCYDFLAVFANAGTDAGGTVPLRMQNLRDSRCSLLSGTFSDGLWECHLVGPDRVWEAGHPFIVFSTACNGCTLYTAAIQRFGMSDWPGLPNGPQIPERSSPGTCSGEDRRQCLVETISKTQGSKGHPINTRTGSLDEAVTDLSFQTSAGRLAFERDYSSLATDVYTVFLGYGWTHNHETRLILPGQPGGEAGAVWFKAHTTSQLLFSENGDGTYDAFPGVLATLTRNSGPPVTYTLVDIAQDTYVFDGLGRLLTWSDSQGHTWTYTFDGNGRLDRVTDDTGDRFLDFDYDGQGRIERVADHTGRDVTFGYDPTSGDLTTVVDVLDRTWTYTYDSAHRLRQILDPDSDQVVRTEYDAEGRAHQQYDGSDALVLQITYNPDGTTTILDALGGETTHLYDERFTLTETVDGLGNSSGRTYDPSFRPDSITDENENTTQLTWSPNGSNLTQIIDAEGGQADLTYDSLNNLRTVVDARRFTTTYTYNETDPDPSRRTLLLGVEDALSNPTEYTYTDAADFPEPSGLLETITDPLLHTTEFVYNAYGQRIQAIDPLDHSTYYSYDSLGRLRTTTDPLGHVSWTCYDAADRVVRTVVNATGDGGTPQTDPCNASQYVPSTDPDKDRVSSTVYDERGNAIASIDPSGMITRTYYDEDDRPRYVVQNLVGQPVETETPPNGCQETASDENVCTEYVYEDAGNQIAVYDPNRIITRTYYDANGRVQYVVVNLVGQSIGTGTPPNGCVATAPDENVCAEYVYDDAGNQIAFYDANRVVTRTYFDGNNRPVTVVQNLTGWSIQNPDPPSRSLSVDDQNLRTDTTYDAAGNAIATTDPAGVITRTYYDPLNRPQYAVVNLVGQGIETGSPPNGCQATAPDENVCTEYVYDDAGNQIAVYDPNRVITRSYYDDAGRPQYMVANLAGQAIGVETPPNGCQATAPDENVCTEYVYDDAGNQIAIYDPNRVITRTYYDGLGRVRFVVRNLTGQSITEPNPPAYNPVFPDRNVRAETVYDADGDAIATIDNAGIITRTYFDDLHRPVTIAQNLTGQGIGVQTPPTFDPDFPDQNVRSDTIYGPAGEVLRAVDTLGHETVSCYDGQGRVIKTVQNPSVGDPCGSYTPSAELDLDLITLTVYDAAGNRLSVTDPNGLETAFNYDDVSRLTSETDPLSHGTSYGYDLAGNRVSITDPEQVVTRFEYDALSRLSAVVENYLQGQPANQETNVRTEYGYDPAGYRLTILDGNNHTTTFTYDDLGRLHTESDALGHTWTHGYDAAGNHISLLDAEAFTTIFSYDGLNRPTAIDYPAPDADVTFTYNAAGNRATMVDGVGTTTWDYDHLSRPSSVLDPFGGTVAYTYDGLGNRATLTYPDTRTVSYVYNDAGRLETVTDWESLITAYTYDRGGRPAMVALPNGVTTSYSFDDGGRLLSLAHESGGTTLSSFGYTYDDVGDRLTAVETVRQPSAAASELWVADTGSNRGVLFDVASITNGEAAVDLLGQYDASGGILYTKNAANDGPNVRGFNAPFATALDTVGHHLFVSDTSNNRVLVFDLDASNQLVDRVADAVLGQPNFTSRAASLTASGMNTPRSVAFDAATSRLFVADAGYHRVMVYDVAAITNGESAVNVLGQTSFTVGSSGLAQNRLNGARGLALTGSLLFVGDTANNRVMVFDVPSITNGENAVHVLGQATFTTNTAATSQAGLNSPRGVTVDSSNRLFVADTTNNRVMVFDVAEITDGEAAINVLGQATFTTATAATTSTGLRSPETVVANASARLFAGDSSNHRVMVFDVASITDGEPAMNVLGQTSFTAGSSGLAQNRLNVPYGVSLLDNLLLVADSTNQRVMVFDVASIANGENAVNLAGQVDGSLAPVYTKNGVNDGPNAQGLNLSGAFADYAIDPVGHRLFASDPTNHRVLVFGLDASNALIDHVPDAVLGQTSFWSRTSGATQSRFNSPRGLLFEPARSWLFVTDYSNSRVVVFDVASITNGENAIYVLGQTTFTSGSGATAQNRLKNPVGLAMDDSRGWLFVGDYNNHRVMVFDVNAITNGENAINVLGQASFTTATAATSQTGLRNPSGVALDVWGSRLFVADTNNHRVMVFDVAAIENGEAAVNVLGQATFTTATAATTQAGMRSPQGVVVDETLSRLFVADTNNHRVTAFDVAAIADGENAINVLGQTTFTAGSAATAQNRMNAPRGVLLVTSAVVETTTIAYSYDPLYRLTAADYDGGTYFHYTYDAVGNRLTEATQSGSTDYVYDIANRMTSVGGVTYSWSDNGNLLSDGASTYTYDHANRLTSVAQGADAYSFAYNGDGDRLRQTVNGVPASYTLDLAAGLTQVLADESSVYLYGSSRLGEEQTGGWTYHLGDALGSVRQLTNAIMDVTLSRSFEAFGDPLTSAGAGLSVYGFAGEQRDGTGLIYLRSRYYGSYLIQWIQPDPIVPDPTIPADWNRYAYVRNNPVNLVDPSGEYGRQVHLTHTSEWALVVTRAGWCRVAACYLLPSLISRGNQRMDDLRWPPGLLPFPGLGGEYHFETRTGAHADAVAAMHLADPSLFGAALHEIQDSYSHWDEGYTMPLGHGWHWLIVQSRNTVQSRATLHGGSLLSQFYQEHPESELRMQLSTIYPSAEIAGLSRDALVDLYLRTYTGPGSPERDRFGYDTDLYFAFTSRDTEMRNETRGWLAAFAMSLDSCESDRILTHRPPSVSEIRAFLDAQ